MSEITYIELNLPNISYEEAEKSAQRKIVGVQAFMHPFIEALAVKHPEWKFVCNGVGRLSAEAAEANQFKVFEKREELGILTKEYYSRQNAYGIRNERVSATLERGWSKKTTKLDKAIKLVEKTFYTKNNQELYEQGVSVANDTLDRFCDKKRSEINSRWRGLMEEVQGFVLNNFGLFVDKLTEEHKKLAFNLPTLVEEHDEVSNMYLAFRKGLTYNIVIQGSDYLVGESQQDLTIISSDKLPEGIKRKLGMLKLVNAGDAVHGAGIRVNDNTFVVVKGE